MDLSTHRAAVDGRIHPQVSTPVDGFIHPCLCPLRRSLPSQRIATGQTHDTHAVRETPERVAATSSQRHACRSAAYERLCRGESAAYLPHSDGHPMETRRVTNRQSDDPGPCRRCAAVLSSAADAPTYISLGSHARSGLRMRRSPRRAVPCGHRNGASLSATDATNPAAWRRGSAHPDHRMSGWNRVASPRRDGRIPAAFRRPSDGNHEEYQIVNPMIPDLAAAARRFSAAQRTHPHTYRSDRTPGPVCACASRREGPSHADIEMALRCRPRTPATPQLGGEAAPIQIIP